MFAITARIILQFRRDYRTLALLFVVPIVVLSLFGYLFRGGVSNIHLAVVNQDQGVQGPAGQINFASAVIANFKGNDLEFTNLNEADAQSKTRQGEIKAYVVFGPDFSKNLSVDHHPIFKIVLEGSNPIESPTVATKLQREIVMALS